MGYPYGCFIIRNKPTSLEMEAWVRCVLSLAADEVSPGIDAEEDEEQQGEAP